MHLKRPFFFTLFLLPLIVMVSCGDGSPGLESSPAACVDKLDNDRDGNIDCDDPECRDYPFCAETLSTASCGDGTVGSGESCDTKIPAGFAGACPTSCDDGNPCTTDKLEHEDTCQAICTTFPVTGCKPGDGCCPTGCTVDNDNDCSPSCGNGALDPGEGCDTAISADKPGACPASCDDGIACTIDKLLGAGTCNASCGHDVVTQCANLSDGCCPIECTAADDADCSPSCGNAVLEPNETCDTKIPAGAPGACPTPATCDDGNPCTQDTLINDGTCAAVCSSSAITACTAGDGCCPSGCTNNTDADCSASCGNGALEVNETCDTKVPDGQPGACPSTCDDGNGCTIDQLLNGGTCAAVCSHSINSSCSGAKSDSCCPVGCNANTDADCSPSCGNGVLEASEICDTKIPAGQKGACPTGCNDGNPCTLDQLLNGGTCSATCITKTINSCSGAKSDSCCPAGCNANTDADCSPSCGNGVLETNETCDTKIPTGQNGACPTGCDDGKVCTLDQLLNGGTCGAICSYKLITACSLKKADGCCPSSCNANTDADCKPQCGNGVLEKGEICDTKIKPGSKGACPTSCDDGDLCTADKLSNPATCQAKCLHSAPPVCDDKNPCTKDQCNPKTGKCEFTQVVCNDGNGCTNDVCDKETGKCVFSSKCNDFNLCTKDSCFNGKCLYIPKKCDDSNFCTENKCNPKSGLCYFPTTNCDDGNVCTKDWCEPKQLGCQHTYICKQP